MPKNMTVIYSNRLKSATCGHFSNQVSVHVFVMACPKEVSSEGTLSLETDHWLISCSAFWKGTSSSDNQKHHRLLLILRADHKIDTTAAITPARSHLNTFHILAHRLVNRTDFPLGPRGRLPRLQHGTYYSNLPCVLHVPLHLFFVLRNST